MISRVVLDSNVIISGFLFGGAPARLLEYMVSGTIDCFTSLPILDEVRDVLQRTKFGLSPEQAFSLVEELYKRMCFGETKSSNPSDLSGPG